jgi:hypothetical protein
MFYPRIQNKLRCIQYTDVLQSGIGKRNKNSKRNSLQVAFVLPEMQVNAFTPSLCQNHVFSETLDIKKNQ